MSTLWIIQDGAEMEDGPPRPRLPPLPLPGRHHLLRHRAPHREVSGITQYPEHVLYLLITLRGMLNELEHQRSEFLSKHKCVQGIIYQG